MYYTFLLEKGEPSISLYPIRLEKGEPHEHWHQTGLNSKGAPIHRTSRRNTKSKAHICMISGRGIKTKGTRAPVAPPSLAPLHMNIAC